MAIHTVYVTPTPVVDGVPISKDTATIDQMMVADTEMRILPDDDVPNSAGRPTIEEYLVLENTSGFSPKTIANTMIVTES